MSVFPFFFSCPFSFFGVVSDTETGNYLKATPLVEDFSYSGMIYFKLFLNPSLLRGHSQSNCFPEDLGELFRCGHVDMNRFEQLREQQRLDSSSCYEKDLLILMCFDFFHHCYSVANEYVKKVNNFQRVYFLFHKADLRGNGEES